MAWQFASEGVPRPRLKARPGIQVLKEQVAPGGKVIWRSASNAPPYARLIEAAGFDVRRLQVATDGYMGRVNMYSSFYCAVRRK